MFVDFRSGASPDEFEADLCIVGAGAAGITLARLFADTPFDVCMVEGGGLTDDPESQALYEGDSVGELEIDPGLCRVRTFGGSCNYWGGGCVPLGRTDLEPRAWVPDSGWPMTWSELAPYYRRARSVCRIGSPPLGDGTFSTRSTRALASLDPELLVHRHFMRSTITFGEALRAELKRASNLHVLLHANVLELMPSEAAGSIRTVRIGTVEGRAGTIRARYFVLACGGIENARLLLLSNSVTPAGLGNDRDLVGRYFMDHPCAKLGTLFGGDPDSSWRAYKRDPLADGPVALPQICLSPAVQRRLALLNARVRPLGKEGPVPHSVRVARALREALRGFAAEPELPFRIEEANGGNESRADPEREEPPVPRTDRPTGARVRDVVRAARRKLSSEPVVPTDHVELVGFFEQAPNRESRILLGDEPDRLGQRKVRVDWRVTALDRRSQRTAAAIFGEELARAFRARWKPEPWVHSEREQPRLRGTAHHHGTTRMADEPTRGVVDPECRVHGIDNLYVAGSSVFPTVGWAFPTFTIVALSLRLGDHLLERLRAPSPSNRPAAEGTSAVA